MGTLEKPRVIITGGCGNLGNKLAHYFTSLNRFQVHVFEQPGFFHPERIPEGVRVTVADIRVVGEWTKEFAGAIAVVHFAAVNPYVEASWAESADSLDMNNNVFLAACHFGVPRVVFASSNHVMGGYKDLNSAGAILDPPKAPLITPVSTPLVGTVIITDKHADSTPYAVAKFGGERLSKTLSYFFPKTSFIVLRIGWCQPGANTPDTMSPMGSIHAPKPKQDGKSGDTQRDLTVLTQWFQLMWLSNPDFVELLTLAVTTPLSPELKGFALLNGMSNNKGMRWDLGPTLHVLGYSPKSDSQAKDPRAGDPLAYGLDRMIKNTKSKL